MTNDLVQTVFAYDQIDTDTAQFLHDATFTIRGSWDNARETIGRTLKAAQERLSKNGYGCFESWVDLEFNFSADTARRLIGVHDLIAANCGDRLLIAQLPKSLTYEIATPSADPELKAAVLAGDITTRKEYMDLFASKLAADKELKRVEDDLIAAEEENNRLDEELTKAQKGSTKNKKSTTVVEVPPADYEALKAKDANQSAEIKAAQDRILLLEQKLGEVQIDANDRLLFYLIQELERLISMTNDAGSLSDAVSPLTEALSLIKSLESKQ